MPDTDTTEKEPEVKATSDEGEDQGPLGAVGAKLHPISVNDTESFDVGKYKIKLYSVTPKVRPRSKVIIAGHDLAIYDNIVFFTSKTGDTEWKTIDLHLAHGDNDSISFIVPDLNQILADDDYIQVKLGSARFPAAEAKIFPYLSYSTKVDNQDGVDGRTPIAQSQKKQNQKTTEGEEAKVGGTVDVVMAGMGALGGVVAPFIPGSGKKENRENLDKALKSGDKGTIKKAIAKAKKDGHTDILKESLNSATDPYVRKALEDAIGGVDAGKFKPEKVDVALSSDKALKKKAVKTGEPDNDDLLDQESNESGGDNLNKQEADKPGIEDVFEEVDKDAVDVDGLIDEDLKVSKDTVVAGPVATASLEPSVFGEQAVKEPGADELDSAKVESGTIEIGNAGQVSSAAGVMSEETGQASAVASGGISGAVEQTVTKKTSAQVSGGGAQVVVNAKQSISDSEKITQSVEGQTSVEGKVSVSETGEAPGSSTASAKVLVTGRHESEDATQKLSGTAEISQPAGGSQSIEGKIDVSVAGEAPSASTSNITAPGKAEASGVASAKGQAGQQVELEKKQQNEVDSQPGKISSAPTQVASAEVTTEDKIKGELQSDEQAKPESGQEEQMPEAQAEPEAPSAGSEPETLEQSNQITAEESVEAGAGRSKTASPKSSTSAQASQPPRAKEINALKTDEKKEEQLSPQTEKSGKAQSSALPRQGQVAEGGLKLKTSVRPGLDSLNHNQTQTVPKRMGGISEKFGKNDKTIRGILGNGSKAGVDGLNMSAGVAGAGEKIKTISDFGSKTGLDSGEENQESLKGPGNEESRASTAQPPVSEAGAGRNKSDESLDIPVDRGDSAPLRPGGKKSEEEADISKPAEEEDGENQTGQPDESPVPLPQKQFLSNAKGQSLDEAAKLINASISAYLLQGAVWIWAAAIPTIGLSILVGAILGDLLFLLKSFLVKRAIGVVSVAGLGQGINISQFSPDQLAEKVQFSTGVKANIIAMNLAACVVLAIVFLFFGIILYAGCTSPLGETISSATNFKASVIGGMGFSDVCQALVSGLK